MTAPRGFQEATELRSAAVRELKNVIEHRPSDDPLAVVVPVTD